MFANLRGVPKPAIDQTVDEVIKMFNLEDHADKECRSYSGGRDMQEFKKLFNFQVYLLCSCFLS